MRTVLVISYVMAVAGSLCLFSCGESSPEDEREEGATSTSIKPPVKQKDSAEVQGPTGEAEKWDGSETTFAAAAVSKFSPEIEDQIDDMINGRTNLKEVMEDPEVMKMVKDLFQNVKPSPEIEKRMKEATKLLVAAQFPDADLKGPNIESKYKIEPTDMSLARLIIGHSLTDDPKGMFDSMIKWAEAAADQAAVDPGSDNGVQIDRRPAK